MNGFILQPLIKINGNFEFYKQTGIFKNDLNNCYMIIITLNIKICICICIYNNYKINMKWIFLFNFNMFKKFLKH